MYVKLITYSISPALSPLQTHTVYIHGDIHDNVVSATLMTLSVPQCHQRGLNPRSEHHHPSPSPSESIKDQPSRRSYSSSAWTRWQPTFKPLTLGHSSSLTIYSWQANTINNCKTKRRNKRTVWASTEYFRPQTNRAIRIDGKDLKTATIFKYLGSVISSDRMKWRRVTSVLSDRWKPIQMKAKIYNSVVHPIALYASWVLATSNHEQALHAM